MALPDAVIDALDRPPPKASIGTSWQLIADRVMGGRSTGSMTRETVAGRAAIRLAGDVSLADNGGFLQIALDLAPEGRAVDARGWSGIEIDVHGNGESYNLHLRTNDVTRPWQSYRRSFVTPAHWRRLRLGFDGFVPHRIDAPLDLSRLRRIGIVAIGRAFHAEIAIAGVRFFAGEANRGRGL